MPDLASQPASNRDRVEPIIWVLFAGSVIFALMMIVMARLAPDDGNVFTALMMLSSGYASSLWTRVKPAEKLPPPGSTTLTSTSQITQTEEPK